ncbi:MAG: hypothetical protein R2769_07065 [Saprospiraceae bacterium]
MKNKNLMVGLLALFCLGFYQLNAQTVTRNTPVYIGKWNGNFGTSNPRNGYS